MSKVESCTRCGTRFYNGDDGAEYGVCEYCFLRLVGHCNTCECNLFEGDDYINPSNGDYRCEKCMEARRIE